MVRLQILNGRKAGLSFNSDSFPLVIGRATSGGVVLEESGVWDQHFQISLDSDEGFFLEVFPPALASVNDQPVERILLRNGDLITAGSAKLQFWLQETRQASLRLRETGTLLSFFLLCAAQFGIIYWLLN